MAGCSFRKFSKDEIFGVRRLCLKKLKKIKLLYENKNSIIKFVIENGALVFFQINALKFESIV